MDYETLLQKALNALPEKRQIKTSRFKPPVIISFVQGSKTIIRNYKEVCETIRRDVNILAKYFSKELAVPAKIEGTFLVIQGKFDERTLNERLTYYIKKYVLCKECNQPDTRLENEGRGIILMICEACGARTTVGA